jgi:2-polyprenyl-3-methyl-5-hydroxy-6-metoxy-1,4-benzoquinol methylase
LATIDSSRPRTFFEQATIYLSNTPSIRLRSEIIRSFLGEPQRRNILDIGCGDGSLSLPFAEKNKVTLLDFSSAMLDAVRTKLTNSNKANVELLQADFEKYQFNKIFNDILCVGVLAHVQDVKRTIDKIVSVLEPNGQVIFQISDVNHWYYRLRSFRKGQDQYGYTLNKISPKALIDLCEKKNLKYVKTVRYPVVYPFLKFFNERKKYSFLKFVANRPSLRVLASEHIMLFEKR